MTKLSIITINFNNKAGLKRTFDSIFLQSNNDFEYIVIDGDSNDGSKNLIEYHQEKIDYWVSEKDNGIYHAMNKGILASKGEYLLFMNSGDVLINDVNILNECYPRLSEDIVAFDCFLEKNNIITGRRTHIEKPTLFYVFKNGLKHQSTFIRKSLFKKLGLYNENYKIVSDYEFWIRCFLEPTTSSVSYTLPIAIFELNGISQRGNLREEFHQVEQQLLPHLLLDFKHFEKLLAFDNSRVLQAVIKMQLFLKKIIKLK